MRKRSMGLILTCLIVLLVRALAIDPKRPAMPPEIIILSGNPMGSVKFRHRLHTDVREIQCIACHHASMPQKPGMAPEQACRSCHVSIPVKPMVTNIEAAFHNDDATAGLCISCHISENAEHKNKLAPVKCMQCHDPEDVLPNPTAGN